MLVALACALLAWLVIDPLQEHALVEIFQDDLEQRLEVQAQDARQRFEGYLREMTRDNRDVAQDWRLVEHVHSEQWRESGDGPLVYTTDPPPWLEAESLGAGGVQPSQLILLDARGRPREIYRRQDLPFPIDKALDLFPFESSGVIVTLWKVPYFLTWAKIGRVRDEEHALLMAVIPLNEAFLRQPQLFTKAQGLVVGLLDGDRQLLLSSSDRRRVTINSHLGDWRGRYLQVIQPLDHYHSAQGHIRFFTMLPRARVAQQVKRILAPLRREWLFVAFLYMTAFGLLFFLISWRISVILRRISQFGASTLGMAQARPGRGNQLVLLEERLAELLQQVSQAREASQAQQEFRIRESEALKSALLDNSLDPIITVDNRGLIIEANITAVETFGYAREEMLGKALDALVIHPKDRLRIRQLLIRCRQPSTPRTLCRAQKLLGLDLHGVEIPLECSVMPIDLRDRTVFTVYLRDITLTENAERQIKSLAKFASENPSPVLRVNSKGVIIYANVASDALLHYWGCERGQTLPLYWRNLVFESLQDGLNREYEINLDEQIISLLMAPVLELDYVNLYGRDITLVRQAEQQSRKHQSDLVHVCRVSTMGEMATGLAHELNQPLSAIVNFASGCVRRLQAGIGGEAELVDAMAQITAQAERAGEIIKRLRTLVSKRPHEQSEVNLNNLVLEVVSFVEYDANKSHIEVSLELYRGELLVKVDLVQIEQVILNLVRNAIDALKQEGLQQRKLELATRRISQDEVEVMVRDSGPGISAETVEHLFDAFFSTKESGMGMGLAISRKIVESHRGKISVISEPGRGAEFHIILPTDIELKKGGD